MDTPGSRIQRLGLNAQIFEVSRAHLFNFENLLVTVGLEGLCALAVAEKQDVAATVVNDSIVLVCAKDSEVFDVTQQEGTLTLA